MPLFAIVIIVVVAVVVLSSAGLLAFKRGQSDEHALHRAHRVGTATLDRPPEEVPAGPTPLDQVPTEEVLAGQIPNGRPPSEEPPGPDVVAVLEAPRPETGVSTEPARRETPALRDRLGRARSLLGGYLGAIRKRGLDETTFDELEEALILADVGLATTTTVLDGLRSRLSASEIEPTPEALLGALRADLEAIFEGDSAELRLAGEPFGEPGAEPDAEPGMEPGAAAGAAEGDGAAPGTGEGEPAGPTVWLLVGVNGVGKTTTIGKLAARETASGRSVVLAAGDTFRAAAGEQLETWAQRSGARVIRGADGADPSSVIFDAVQHAAARRADLVIADTAGRLHTKVNLMEELRKVRRIAERPPGHLTEVLLVLDATVGQNGLVQARQFTDSVGVTGVVLTKLDGTAKGGIVLAVRHELGVPVKLVGVGEGIADLIEFEPKEFVSALFE
ncbi:MAG: signal recognition particle-docking protein FtsY [Acidimicrobiales bacterium]